MFETYVSIALVFFCAAAVKNGEFFQALFLDSYAEYRTNITK